MEGDDGLGAVAIGDVDALRRRRPRWIDEDLLRVLDDVTQHDGEARRSAADRDHDDIVLAVVFDVRERQDLGRLDLIAEVSVDDFDRRAIAFVDLRDVVERGLPSFPRQRLSVLDVLRHDNACSSCRNMMSVLSWTSFGSFLSIAARIDAAGYSPICGSTGPRTAEGAMTMRSAASAMSVPPLIA